MKPPAVTPLRELHAHLIRTNLHTNPTSAISLVLLSYTSSSSTLPKAHHLFNQLHNPTPFLYSTLLRAFTQHDNPTQAIRLYNQMRLQNVSFTHLTFIFTIKACTLLRDVKLGNKAHLGVLKSGFGSHLYVCNGLVHMYGSFSDVGCCRKLFDEMSHRDLVSWNSLICGYSGNGQFREVLNLFREMQVGGVKGDAVTMVKVVLACSYLGDWEYTGTVVKYIEENNVKVDVYLGNTLVDMYGRRGSVELARGVFDQMDERNIVSWNTMILTYAKAKKMDAARELFDEMLVKDVISWTSMITGYSQVGKFEDALVIFREMMKAKVKPDEITVASVLSACAHVGNLDFGKAVHRYIFEHKVKADIHVGNALIDMYFKCGCMEMALEVFEKMVDKDTVSWSSVITGLAVSRNSKEALEYFSEMLRKGVPPSDVTYIGVLVACTHAGLVDEGLQHFANMKKLHQVEPSMKHYGCVVDLLSRSGLFDKAYEFIKSIPVRTDAIVWRILLSACKVHENVVLAEIALEKLLELDPNNSGNYVLLSNTYAGADRWGDAVTVRKLMTKSDVQKEPGCSSIDVNGSVPASITEDMLLV